MHKQVLQEFSYKLQYKGSVASSYIIYMLPVFYLVFKTPVSYVPKNQMLQPYLLANNPYTPQKVSKWIVLNESVHRKII